MRDFLPFTPSFAPAKWRQSVERSLRSAHPLYGEAGAAGLAAVLQLGRRVHYRGHQQLVEILVGLDQQVVLPAIITPFSSTSIFPYAYLNSCAGTLYFTPFSFFLDS